MKRILAALRFLTVLPIPVAWGGDSSAELARSLPAFPLAGIALGVLTAGFAWLAVTLLPPWPAAVLIVFLLVGLSGGLHLDGLADTADGFFSVRGPEQTLKIMRDSQIGTMGALALIGVLLLKVATLAALPETWMVVATGFLMPLAGRTALVLGIASLPYARAGQGLATVFYQRPARWSGAWAIAVMIGLGWLVAARVGLAIAAAVLMVTLVMGGYVRRKIGGATGDTLGATCELAEAAVPLAWCIIMKN